MADHTNSGHNEMNSDISNSSVASKEIGQEESNKNENRIESDPIATNDAEKQPNGQIRSTGGPPPPPDGGYGWVCVTCCAFINANTWGLNSSYGVFLAHYLANNLFPGAGRLEYAFVGGLSIGAAMLISPVATLTTRLFGTRTTLFIGIFLETGSFIGASFASQIWQLFLSQGICFGLGMGFLFVGSAGIPPQWFSTKRSLANGVSAAGSGVGGLVYSLAAGAIIKQLGLAWAFRILGIIACAFNSVCALLIRDRNKIIGSSQKMFESSLFKRPEYLLLNGYGFFSMLAYVVLIFSLANYANAIGLNAQQASVVSAVLNLGQALGRPPIGYFSDTIGRINMAAMMTFFSAFCVLFIWIFTKTYGVLIFYSIIGGTVAGTFWATIAPTAAEVVGLKNVPSALNLEWLVIALPTICSEPIALEIVKGTGGYLGAQLFTGFMYLAATICLIFLRGWKIGELNETARLKGLAAEDIDAVTSDGDQEDAAKAGRRSMVTNCWKWRKV
ncbi:Hypothetical protein R9X50_00201800 [Acrodontium crateriforme]|uniref:MFS transporter n=1 Tax=Acrodontium crateriforme TaxID=150365 RepID=A0AAQ3M0R0_9PEZI|nr:Hypothetical protein R9X50_00201800 [Acrodontium crateriforme]